MEIKLPIDTRDGNAYIPVNEIFYPTTLSNINKMMKDFYFDFERLLWKTNTKCCRPVTCISNLKLFMYLMGFVMLRCCATFWTRKSNSSACGFIWKKAKWCHWLTCFSNIGFYRPRVQHSTAVRSINRENPVRVSTPDYPLWDVEIKLHLNASLAFVLGFDEENYVYVNESCQIWHHKRSTHHGQKCQSEFCVHWLQ